MKRRIVVSFTAGLLAASGCGGKEPIPGNPPPVIGDNGLDGPSVAELEKMEREREREREREKAAEAEGISDTEAGSLNDVPPSDLPVEPINSNPPSPGVGTGPDGMHLVPVPPPALMPSRAKPLPTW